MLLKFRRFLLFLFLVNIKSISAQPFNFGVQTGIVLSNIDYTGNTDFFGGEKYYHTALNYSINGIVRYKSNSFIGFTAEPGFIQKGSNMHSDSSAKNEEFHYQLHYLQMPVLVDFYLTEKLFVSVGPEIAYLLNAKVKIDGNSNDINNFYDKNFEISGLVGVTYSLIKNLNLGIRYSHGLNSIVDLQLTDAEGNDAGEMKEYNHYFQVLLCYQFR